MLQTIEYAKALAGGKAFLVIPGKAEVPATPAVVDKDGNVVTPEVPAVPGTPDQTFEISSQIEGLYFLTLGKTSKFPGARSLPVLKALGLADKPTDKVWISFHYLTKTHEAWYHATVAQAVDKATCSYQCFNDPAIAAAMKVIEARQKEIADAHTVCDGNLVANGKGQATEAAPLSGAMAFLAQLEAQSPS